MFTVTRCFEVVTPESAENGDIADSGIQGDEKFAFRELVDAVRGGQLSSCPVRRRDIDAATAGGYLDWVILPSDTNYQTGEETTETLHLSRNTRPSDIRRWYRALEYAGVARIKD